MKATKMFRVFNKDTNERIDTIAAKSKGHAIAIIANQGFKQKKLIAELV